MRAHILAIAAVSGVIIISLAAGRALTEHLLTATPQAPAVAPGPVSEAIPVPRK